MIKQSVSVLILDLDNTLFDWFELWYQSFSSMLDRLVHDSGIPRDYLLLEIKKVHQRRGTSEYAFLIEELAPLRAAHPGEDLGHVFASAIDAYRAVRDAHLALYPGVMSTLQTLNEHGCLIVIYTESMGFYSNERVYRLGLDGVIDILYTPEDHDFPENLTLEQVQKYSNQYRQLGVTEHRHTPTGVVKPSSDVLLKIVQDIGAPLDEVVYIGDDLAKDIFMAKEAHVTDVWARYGKSYTREEYTLLKSVTHWSSQQIQLQQELTEAMVRPSIVLKASFAEILTLFDFKAHRGGYRPGTLDRFPQAR